MCFGLGDFPREQGGSCLVRHILALVAQPGQPVFSSSVSSDLGGDAGAVVPGNAGHPHPETSRPQGLLAAVEAALAADPESYAVAQGPFQQSCAGNDRSPLDAFILKRLKFARRWAVPLGCCSTLSLIIIILFCVSFKKLGAYNYGLVQNTVTKRVYLDDGVYEPGVYFLGFWKGFVTFPSTIQSIQYSEDAPEEGVQHTGPLVLRSIDAKPIRLEVSVQYQRKKGELPQLFARAMGADVQENIFISELRAGLTKVMSRYNAEDCWKRRETLIQAFTRACEEVLDRNHAKCWGLQFYRSQLTRRFEEELVRTQVQKQQQLIESAKRRAAEVRAETQIFLANDTARIRVIESQGAAERYKLKTAAVTVAEVNKVDAEASAMRYVLEALRLPTGPALTEEQLAEYQKYLMLGDSMTEPPLFSGLGGSPEYVAVPSGPRRLGAASGLPSGQQLQATQDPSAPAAKWSAGLNRF